MDVRLVAASVVMASVGLVRIQVFLIEIVFQ